MQRDRKSKFVNPLLRPSPETETHSSPLPATSPETLPSPITATEPSTFPATLPSTEAETFTSTSISEAATDAVVEQYRKRGKQAFEKTHERLTVWVTKKLKRQFNALARDEEISKTQLMNEAIVDLLKKREKL